MTKCDVCGDEALYFVRINQGVIGGLGTLYDDQRQPIYWLFARCYIHKNIESYSNLADLLTEEEYCVAMVHEQ